MKCDEVTALLPEYVEGLLERGEMLQIQAHTSTCNTCYTALEETATVLGLLDAWPDEVPSERLRTRFFHMLEAADQGLDASQEKDLEQKPARVIRFPLNGWHALAAAALLCLGLLLGQQLSPDSPTVEIAGAPNQQVQQMARQVSLSLMRHVSPSERLEGVRYTTELGSADPEVVKALLHTLTEDTNINVRLAAVNALYRFSEEPQVRLGLAQALERESSPMVQLALIECLSDLNEPAASDSLEQLLGRRGINPLVRKKADESLRVMH